jgi:hypothetical protein
MLEVVKPAAKRGIEIGNNTSQAVPTRAPSLLPYPLAQCQQTFPPDPTPPNFEAIAEKLKTLPSLPTVSHVGLAGIELKPVLFDPGSHFAQRGLGLFRRAAQHHEVIGLAHHAVALLSHMAVQGMKIDVGHKRANHRTLRRPAHRRPSSHPFDDVLVQEMLESAPVLRRR